MSLAMAPGEIHEPLHEPLGACALPEWMQKSAIPDACPKNIFKISPAAVGFAKGPYGSRLVSH
jgi:hypothetical protein